MKPWNKLAYIWMGLELIRMKKSNKKREICICLFLINIMLLASVFFQIYYIS